MSGDLMVREGRDLIEGDDRALVEHDDQALLDNNGYQPLPGEQAAKDRQAWAAAESALRKAWGEEYDRRIWLNYQALIAEFGEDLAEDLLFARLDDGRRLADVPEFSKALSDLLCLAFAGAERMGGTSIMSDPEQRKQAIEEIMRTDFPRYQREFATEYEAILNELVRQGKLRAEPWDDAGG
jgi:hypothetical protein